MEVKNCPFCNEPATEPDENNHVMCSAVWCGSDAYMHVDDWNNRPLVKEYARIKELEDELGGWETIDSAPKDGTKVDLWVVFDRTGAMRVSDCYWNKMVDDWQLRGNNAADYMVRPKIEYWMRVPTSPNNKKPA